MTQTYPWPAGTRAALCVTFDFDGESPYLWRQRSDVPDGVAELEQRRYGPRRGIYNVLEVLAEQDVRATFFIPGWIATTYRSAAKAVADAGHEIALHGWCHEPPGDLTPEELQATLRRASDVLGDIAGRAPRGYRSPSFQMTPQALDVLASLGLEWDSSLMGDDRPYQVGDLTEVPVDWATDDAIFYRYTHGVTRPPVPPASLCAAWDAEISSAVRRGTLVNLTMHPWLSGRPARVQELAELLANAKKHEELWIATVGEVADHHRKADHEAPLAVATTEIGWPHDRD
jgi:peptidoglycan/xylan/chitin deacetylase (PgdA/CDA1 family)